MKKIILFGDSLFNGFRNHHNTTVITAGLNERLNNFAQVDNLSKSGATTVEGLDYLAQLPPDFDLIVIEYGTNDATVWGITPENYVKNLQKMIDFCKNRKIIIVGPWKANPNSETAANFIPENHKKIHKLAKTIAQKNNLLFIDLWKLTDGEKDVDKLYQADGLHLTDYGNQKLLNLITPVIKKTLLA